MFIQNLVEFCPFERKRNSDKGHNYYANLRKIMVNNPNLDLVIMNVYTKFGQILSFRSQDIERKQNSDSYQGP